MPSNTLLYGISCVVVICSSIDKRKEKIYHDKWKHAGA